MAIVTQYNPRCREQALNELPDRLLEFEINSEETVQAIAAIPELQKLLDIKRDLKNEFDVKFSGKITVKYFKKSKDAN